MASCATYEPLVYVKYVPPPVMSVKQHLDESRDPSIYTTSESRYSVSSESDLRTPDQVEDRSQTPLSSGRPVTPLIFRSHFRSPPPAPKQRDRVALAAGLANCMQGARTLLDALESSPIVIQEEAFSTPTFMSTPQLRSSSASEHTHTGFGADFVLELDVVTQDEGSADENDNGDDSSSLSSAAEALAAFFQLQKQKPRSVSSASQQSRSISFTSDTQASEDLLSLASNSNHLPYQLSDSARDSLVTASSVSTPSEPLHHAAVHPVAPVNREVNGITCVNDQLTPEPAGASASSPASVVVAAQRRAWLAQFYPPKLHTHHAQLANLRTSTPPVKAGDDHGNVQTRQHDPHSELGSPFGFVRTGYHIPPEQAVPAEEKKPVKSSASLFQKSFSGMSFSAHRTGRRRAQSSAAARPPQLVLTTTAFGQNGRLRAHSDAARSPVANLDLKARQDSSGAIRQNANATDSKAALSLLDEQVFTPVRPQPQHNLNPFHKAPIHRPSTSPAMSWGGDRRGRAHSAEGRVTFAEDLKEPMRIRSPIRSFSSSNVSKLNGSGASKISRLFTFRNSTAQAAATPPTRLHRPSTADQDGSRNRAAGWQESSSPAWNQTPDLSQRQGIQSFDTPGMSTDDSEADSDCSTAPSTPTIPQHLITTTEEKERDSASQSSTTTSLMFDHGIFKPMPLPRVEAQAALRLRPSLRNIRASVVEGEQTSVNDSSSSTRSEVLPFRELKASWEARVREASTSGHHSSRSPSQTTLESATGLELS